MDTGSAESGDRGAERDAMVRRQLEARGIRDTAVLRAMREVPRHEFVPDDLQRHAYEDGPLAIGEGQTVSQPFVVARRPADLGIHCQYRYPEPTSCADGQSTWRLQLRFDGA